MSPCCGCVCCSGAVDQVIKCPVLPSSPPQTAGGSCSLCQGMLLFPCPSRCTPRSLLLQYGRRLQPWASLGLLSLLQLVCVHGSQVSNIRAIQTLLSRSLWGGRDLLASPQSLCSPVLKKGVYLIHLILTSILLFQVSGVHAPQPVTTQHYDPLWGYGLETPILCISWHTALGDGEATVWLTLPAHEWKPGPGLRKSAWPGCRVGHLPDAGFPAPAGQFGLSLVSSFLLCAGVVMCRDSSGVPTPLCSTGLPFFQSCLQPPNGGCGNGAGVFLSPLQSLRHRLLDLPSAHVGASHGHIPHCPVPSVGPLLALSLHLDAFVHGRVRLTVTSAVFLTTRPTSALHCSWNLFSQLGGVCCLFPPEE